MNAEMTALGRVLSEVVARSHEGYLTVRLYPRRPAESRWSVMALNQDGTPEVAAGSTLAAALTTLNDQLRQTTDPPKDS